MPVTASKDLVVGWDVEGEDIDVDNPDPESAEANVGIFLFGKKISD